MAVRYYKPTTNGRRNMSVSTFEEITCSTPEKSLLAPLKKNAGRNNSGKITVRHQGGGEKGNIVLSISNVINSTSLLK